MEVLEKSFGFKILIDSDDNKTEEIEEYMSYHISKADPDKGVYSDIDDSQKQPYSLKNEISYEALIKMSHEINNGDGYEPQGEKKSKSSKGIMKIFRRKRKK